MAAFPANYRQTDAEGQAGAPHRGQLRHTQTSRRDALDQPAQRFHVHFTPTSCSWLNMVERFFRDLTEKRLRRGVFRNVEELLDTIGAFIDKHNRQPKHFISTAKASDILEKVKRAWAVLA